MSSLEVNNFDDRKDGEDDSANVTLQNSNNNSNNRRNELYSAGDDTGITSNASPQPELIVIDSRDDDEEVPEIEKTWVGLPACAVKNNDSFLSRPDQSRIPQVCSAGSRGFSSDSVWKKMAFHLPEHNWSSEICAEVEVARRFGSMFQIVEIICTRVNNCLTGLIWKQLCWFLQILESSSQLTSIKFINMGSYFSYLDGTLRDELLRTIISFFYSQDNLKSVTFQESHFRRNEGLELLKAVLHSDSSTINELSLLGFVKEDPYIGVDLQSVLNLSEVCIKFANVQSLDVDYTTIFEDAIIRLYEKLSSGEYQLDETKPRMTNLKIHYKSRRVNMFRGIPPDSWKYLTNIFPDLQVKMELTIHNRLARDMQMSLVRGIPLQTLNFCFEDLSAVSRISIAALFTHLQNCKYQDHLEVLNINWIPTIENFSKSVINFVQSCDKLQSFRLTTTKEPSGIETILRALLENHPASFKYITILAECGSDFQENNLRSLGAEYYPLFKAKGIDCLLYGDEILQGR